MVREDHRDRERRINAPTESMALFDACSTMPGLALPPRLHDVQLPRTGLHPGAGDGSRHRRCQIHDQNRERSASLDRGPTTRQTPPYGIRCLEKYKEHKGGPPPGPPRNRLPGETADMFPLGWWHVMRWLAEPGSRRE